MPKDSKIELGQSRQVKALAGKALSFQKRQLFTNICCIGLCPLIMVVLAATMGNIVSNLITRNSLSREFVFCSDKVAMNEINLPLWGFGDSGLVVTGPENIPGAKEDTVYHTNFAYVAGKINLRTGPGATAGLFKRPCVTWYGEDYPKSALYERDPKASGLLIRDSSFLAQPLGGWFNSILNGLNPSSNTSTSKDNSTAPLFDFNSLNVFLNYQLKPASIYAVGEGVDDLAVGNRPMEAPIGLSEFLRQSGVAAPAWPIQQGNNTIVAFEKRQVRPSPSIPTAAFRPATGSGGLLDTIPTRYFADFKTGKNAKFNGFLPVPYYNKTIGTDDDLDDRISEALLDIIGRIAKLDKAGITSSDLEVRSEAALRIQEELSTLPHGAVFFKKIDHNSLKYSWNYHYGSDRRITAASSFPAEGQRLLYQQTQLDNAILRNSNTSGLGSAQITQGLRIFPELQNTKIKLPFGGLIGDILYPFGVSFLLPIFCVILVQEKEYRILVMMRMNGMKTWAYYLSHYVTFFILFALSSSIFLLSGVFSSLTLFTRTDPLLLVFLFAVWGNVQIAMAFTLSTVFNKGRIALVISFLLVLCSVIVSLVIGQLFTDDRAPSALFLWPPFAFYRVLNLINFATLDVALRPYTFSDLVGDNEVATATWFMFVEIPAFFFLAYYFDAIVPSEFGVKKPWHFPITSLFQSKDKKSIQGTVATDAVETRFEDQDVRDERERVCSKDFKDSEYPLVMKNMRKAYAGRGGAGPKLAVKDVSFAVEKGITFGLLGPNGAGKSTLISILTGLYPASSGVAILNQFDISTNIAEVYKCIGICPQFDILWNELTISEHLYFYARLKGITAESEDVAVKLALEQVSLLSFKNRLVKGLSGGEKRRLSIAIALLGDPAVVFLDEPTTGLDPEVRRLIWNIVNESRKDRTIVLTTHSMEEAEALCQRIGIMARGTLRCIADQLRLKELYGTGFKLFANCDSEKTATVAKYLENIMPQGWSRIDNYETSISYEFPATKGAISKLFMEIEANRDQIGILDWGLGQTTLEEVFVRLISEADAAAEY